jgi:predicted nucleic acid-binding protein
MKTIADTSGIIALLDRTDKHHTAVVNLVNNVELIIPVTILAEVDYLATKYLGEFVARMFLEDLKTGAFIYLTTDIFDLEQTLTLMTRYSDIPIGFVDASIAALADRYSIQQILTLDRRHFHTIRSSSFKHFNLLP